MTYLGLPKNGIRWFSWSVSVAVAIGILVNIPGEVIGQSQPPQSAEQSAALEEASRINQQVIQLLNEGKYSQGIPF